MLDRKVTVPQDWAAIVQGLPDEQLPELWSATMTEMRRRGLIRSNNNPVADYAESFVQRYVNGEMTAPSMSGYDVMGRDGLRYQVKSRRLASGSSSQLGVIRDLYGDPFDVLMAVLFNERLIVIEMWSIPIGAVRNLATATPYVNGHRLHLDKRLAQHPDVVRII